MIQSVDLELYSSILYDVYYNNTSNVDHNLIHYVYMELAVNVRKQISSVVHENIEDDIDSTLYKKN